MESGIQISRCQWTGPLVAPLPLDPVYHSIHTCRCCSTGPRITGYRDVTTWDYYNPPCVLESDPLRIPSLFGPLSRGYTLTYIDLYTDTTGSGMASGKSEMLLRVLGGCIKTHHIRVMHWLDMHGAQDGTVLSIPDRDPDAESSIRCDPRMACT